MKTTMKKILLAATLVVLGSLAWTKVAKADVSFTYSSSSGLGYTISGETAGGAYEIFADGTISLATGTLDTSGGATGTVSASSLLTALTTTEPKNFAITAKVDGTAITGTETVPVYHLKLVIPTTLEYTLSPSTIESSLTDITYTLTVSAKQAPTYIQGIGITQPLTGGGPSMVVDKVSYSSNAISAANIYEFTAGNATPSLTFDHTDVSPITGTLSWTPSTVQYPWNDLNTTFTPAEGSASQTTYSYPTVTYTFTGHGSGIATYAAGMASTTEYSQTFPFNYAETIRKVVITSGKNTIIKNAAEPYAARVYLDDAGTREAANQNILWSVSPTAGITVTPTTATTTGATVTATALGTYTLTAKSAENNAILDTKTITVENPSESIDHVTFDTTSPTQVAKNGTGTYRATAYKTDGTASSQGVTWSVNDTSMATISSSGVLTAKNNTGTVRVIAKAVSDPSKTAEYTVTIVSRVETGTISYKSIEAGVLKITKKHDSSSDFKLDLGWKKGATGANEGASVSALTYTITGDTSAGSFTNAGVFTPGTADKSITITPRITYTDGTSETRAADEITLQVLKDWTTKLEEGGSSSSSSTSSDYYIGFKLQNNEVYTGYDVTKNIHNIGGYRIEVMKDGNSLASTTVTKSMSIGDTYKISKDTLNELLKDASGDLSGDSTTVTFRVSPYGANQQGNNTYNTDAAKTIERTVYRDNGRYYLDKNGSSSSSNSSSNKGASTPIGGGNAGANLDKVPKTGEGNTRLLILMVAIISATVAGSILLSTLPAKKKSGVDEGVDDKDIFHKKD